MTEDEQTMLLIKGAISELPAPQQQAVHACAQDLRDRIKLAGEGEGLMALALVATEAQTGRLG